MVVGIARERQEQRRGLLDLRNPCECVLTARRKLIVELVEVLNRSVPGSTRKLFEQPPNNDQRLCARYGRVTGHDDVPRDRNTLIVVADLRDQIKRVVPVGHRKRLCGVRRNRVIERQCQVRLHPEPGQPGFPRSGNQSRETRREVFKRGRIAIDSRDSPRRNSQDRRSVLPPQSTVVDDERAQAVLFVRSVFEVHGAGAADVGTGGAAVAGAAVGRHVGEVEAAGIVEVDRNAAAAAGSGTPLSTVAYATIGPDLAGATEDSDMQVDATSAARAVCSRAVGQHQPIQSQRSRSQFDQATAVAAIVVAVVVLTTTTGTQLHRFAIVTIHPANIAGAVMRVRLGPHASVASAGIATGPRNIAIGSSKVCATV